MNNSQRLIYQNPNRTIKSNDRCKEEIVWLTKDHIAKLFSKAKSTINDHMKNIIAEAEFSKNEVMKKFGISEFKQKVKHYLKRRLQPNGFTLTNQDSFAQPGGYIV